MNRRIYRQILISMFILMFVALLMQPLLVILPLGCVFALPTLAVFTRRYAGLMPAYVMLLSMSVVFYLYVSTTAMIAFMLFSLPASLLALYCDKKLTRFAPSVAMLCSAFFVCGVAGLLLFHYEYGDDFIGTFVQSLLRASSHTGYRLPDWLLFGLNPGLLPENGAITDALRETANQNISELFTEFLRSEIPARLVSGSIWGGVLGVYLPRVLDRRRGSRRGEFPDIYTWFLPVPLRLGLLALFLLGVVAFIMRIQAHMTVYFCLFELIKTAYALEGLGLLWWYLREKKVHRMPKVVVSVLMFFLLRTVLMIIGLIDQFANPRHLNMNSMTIDNNEEEE